LALIYRYNNKEKTNRAMKPEGGRKNYVVPKK